MSRRLNDRYELLDELPHVTGGRLFRARDLAFGEIVGVKQLGANCGLAPEPRQHLENTVRHLQSLPHPHLSRIYTFNVEEGLIVQEWIQGISLLDLLRRRRALSASEAFHLVATLPATLDFLAREAVPIPRPLLGKLYVEFAENVDVAALEGTPVDRWPAFCLKLNPLSMRGLLAEPEGDDTRHTILFDPRRPTEIQEGYGPRELTLLLYELLGGRIREVDNRRYSPLSSLREAGNAVLRKEMLSMPHPDCASLWRDLLQAQPGASPSGNPGDAAFALPPQKFVIPESYLNSAQKGSVLNLEATSAESLPMHFVTGSHFTIGRSVAADFTVRILPQNEENDARTNRLSRVHVLLELIDEDITVRDGNGNGPSLNGSSLDGQPLTVNHPAVLAHRGRVRLGEEFALDLVSLESDDAPDWEIENLAAWTAGGESEEAPQPYHAMVCEPTAGHGIVRHGVWLFREIGFALDAAGGIVWDTRSRGRSPAAFHHFCGCFWLRNELYTDPVLAVQDTVVGRGEMVPLSSGTTLRIGSHLFTVQIE